MVFDPTLHPHLAKALAMHDAQYDHDEHGAPATEQFHDYCERVRNEEREACARACDKQAARETRHSVGDYALTAQRACDDCAAAIRARGKR